MAVGTVSGCALGATLVCVMILTPSGEGRSDPFSGTPKIGGTEGMRRAPQLPMIGTSPVKVHLGPAGKPCVIVQGFAKSSAVNPNIFSHMILANNSCSQLIKMQVCYYSSQHCVSTEVLAYSNKEFILGALPAVRDFRFEYREEFSVPYGLGRAF